MYAFWAYDGSIGNQLQGESIHLAFLAVVGGVSCITGAIGVLLRRDLKRADLDKEAMANGIVELGKKLDAVEDRIRESISDLKDKHGSEIQDTRTKINTLYIKLGHEEPDYPSR